MGGASHDGFLLAPHGFRLTPVDTMSDSSSTLRPLAGLAAIAFPGAGHVLLGDVKRGLWIAAGILGMFFGGIFIGGVDVIDSKEDLPWFFGQALVGPIAFGVDSIYQNHFKVREVTPRGTIIRSANPNEGRDPKTGAPALGGTPPNIKSMGKMNEMGTLFATIAGMINLIAIIDAAWPDRRRLDQIERERAGGKA